MKPDDFSGKLPLPACRAAVIDKAFNEEKRIQVALESALRAVSTVDGEVVLADSYSFDRSVELAQAYPICIAQLAHPDKRSCDIGPQAVCHQGCSCRGVLVFQCRRVVARALISRQILKEPAIPTAAVDANSSSLEPLPVPCKNRYESTSWFLPTPTFS